MAVGLVDCFPSYVRPFPPIWGSLERRRIKDQWTDIPSFRVAWKLLKVGEKVNRTPAQGRPG